MTGPGSGSIIAPQRGASGCILTFPRTGLSIEPVTDRRQLRRFVCFPERLYRDDPHWVHPLILEQMHSLSAKHPTFQHVDWQAWTAWREGEMVGRISAQIDALHLDRYNDQMGFFGFYECEDDGEVARRLLSTAAAWLVERGMRRISGPFNLTINAECGLLVDGFDCAPSMMMGHARPYYAKQLLDNGFRGCKDLLAYRMHPDFTAPRVMTRLLGKEHGRIRVRRFNRQRKDAELSLLREIFNDAWSSNWHFVPFTRDEFADIGRGVLALVSDDFVQIAELNGEPVAFIIAMPNINEVLATMNGRLLPVGWLKLLWGLKVRCPNSVRIPLMGVRKQWQGGRFGPMLAFAVIDEVRKAVVKKHMSEVEMSWILDDNAGMRNIIESLGGKVRKTYRIYEKVLANA